jgi:uncharacterized membrane protein (UPF0127 family)
MDLAQVLDNISESYRFLAGLNVIDIDFESGHSLEVYVALSPHEKKRGLAHLDSIDADGMLFCYDTPTYSPFTMRDMKFDLDIAWFDASGALIGNQTWVAGSKLPMVCHRSFSYALEVPAGTLPVSNLKIHG